MRSIRITRLNVVLTLFIILLHGHYSPKLLCLSDCPLWYDYLEHFMVNVFTAAVPTFFAISAYLLFRNYENLNDYKNKVKSRVYSLIIPYLCFSTGLLIITNVLLYIKNGSVETTMHSIINDIYYCKYDSPIWYLRALFYYVLFSPIVLFFLKKGMCWILFIISAITCFTFPPRI